MNVYVEGYYGVKNLGDDYILLSILTSLSKRANQIDNVTILSSKDDYEHVFSLFPQIKCSVVHTKAERKSHLKNDDVYIFGGGGVIPYR